MSKLNQLTLNSTLGDFPLHDFQVNPKTPGKVLANVFAFRPDRPGAIMADESRMIGMISRHRFNDWMSSPYGIEGNQLVETQRIELANKSEEIA